MTETTPATTGRLDGLVQTSKTDWTPLAEPGIDTRGISLKALHRDAGTGRPISFLLRFEPGSRYPYHSHPAGEEIFVVDGTCIIEEQTLSGGDYLYTPPGGKHAVRTDDGCTLFFRVPEEVQMLAP